jgi:ABC-type multidrug transport system fused ATPase/permease subunit
VLVLERGVPVELGNPQQLAAQGSGAFRRLLDAEHLSHEMAE